MNATFNTLTARIAIAQRARKNCYCSATASNLRDRAAPGGGLKSEWRAAAIEGDGGLRLEYPDGCFGIYAYTLLGRQRPVW